jgi:hypothetical protein
MLCSVQPTGGALTNALTSLSSNGYAQGNKGSFPAKKLNLLGNGQHRVEEGTKSQLPTYHVKNAPGG